MDIEPTYKNVIEQYAKISRLQGATAILHWDHMVNLPPKGVAKRGEQLAILEGLVHEWVCSPRFVEGINQLHEVRDELDFDQQANVRELKREVDRATKVPPNLVQELARHGTISHQAWAEARKNSDFAAFAPYLKKMIELRKQEAACLGFADRPYDALLDLFEPYADEASTKALLDDLRGRLVPFLQKILAKPKHDLGVIVGKNYPIDKQREFGLKVIKQFGFDFEGGRQDISVHPFCTGSLGDVRITTRFYKDDLRPSLFGMMHEGGHALYEQGIDPANVDTPLGESVSLGVHESQSRMWENLVGRGLPLWKHFYGDLRQTFPEALSSVGLDEFYKAINVVEGSLIRVEADEATYNMHIILRFELESEMFNGGIEVEDLPQAWNSKMKQYLDVDVPDDAQGVLQDVHWCEGMMGYFPTYTLGNLYASQLFAKASQDLGDLGEMFAQGEFKPLLDWLRTNVHSQGKRYVASELVERVTGKPPSAEDFMKYLETKFGALYDL
ncbi:MAG: carboxypeptidase M32 [Candidatus Alcyoniella australis]|nr:carboxypeptidase M32 [Candidatus Alcyoniella australis]